MQSNNLLNYHFLSYAILFQELDFLLKKYIFQMWDFCWAMAPIVLCALLNGECIIAQLHVQSHLKMVHKCKFLINHFLLFHLLFDSHVKFVKWYIFHLSYFNAKEVLYSEAFKYLHFNFGDYNNSVFNLRRGYFPSVIA